MRIFLLFVLTFLGLSGTVHARDNVHVVTENMKPFNYEENSVVRGTATNIVKAVLSEAGIDYNISVYPWARAYNMARHKENVLIYSIMRTKRREPLFKWIGRVGDPVPLYVYKLKKRTDINLGSISPSSKYQIGVIADGPTKPYLLSMGVEEKDLVDIHAESHLSLVKMLKSERLDLVAAGSGEFTEAVALAGFSDDSFEKGRPLATLTPYIAASLSTSDELVDKIIDAYNRLLKRGDIKLGGERPLHN